MTTDNKTVQTIPFDSEIKITISGKFNARLQELYFFLAQQKSVEDFAKILQEIRDNPKDNDDYTAAIRTIHALVTEISMEAVKQGQTKDIPISELKVV